MIVQVKERTIEEIELKLSSMNTVLNKINYLESVIKWTGFDFEVKRFLWGKLSEFYSEEKMFERSAKAMSNRASLEVMSNERFDSYITAAEIYSKVGKIEDADEMFTRSGRDLDAVGKRKVKLARKNIYLLSAKELEDKGKKASAVKFYEKLIKMDLEEIEKNEIKEKLISTYTSLGMFREAKILEGI
jgi:tetratricopeptide (TPR) repeat protein|tara:strand:- start:522 stop:1085 length:564 start_codon:yes stop_codon:yes gene_type:complete